MKAKKAASAAKAANQRHLKRRQAKAGGGFSGGKRICQDGRKLAKCGVMAAKKPWRFRLASRRTVGPRRERA